MKLCRFPFRTAEMLLMVALTAGAADPRPGTTQVTGYAGLITGIGTHSNAGIGVAYTASRRVALAAEFSYAPGGREFIGGQRFGVESETDSYEFHAGFHYLFPRRRARLIPYGAFGMGGIYTSASTTIVSGTLPRQPMRVRASSTDFYVNVGGGLRYYLSEHWGLRPELKLFAGQETFVRLAVGVFYQFGE